MLLQLHWQFKDGHRDDLIKYFEKKTKKGEPKNVDFTAVFTQTTPHKSHFQEAQYPDKCSCKLSATYHHLCQFDVVRSFENHTGKQSKTNQVG